MFPVAEGLGPRIVVNPDRIGDMFAQKFTNGPSVKNYELGREFWARKRLGVDQQLSPGINFLVGTKPAVRSECQAAQDKQRRCGAIHVRSPGNRFISL
jgi:hypothetical protein